MNRKVKDTKHNNFRLIEKTRNRIYLASKGKIKSSSTKKVLGIDIGTYRKWIEWQMTPEMNWSKIEIDHVKPICMFDISNHEELGECFNWKKHSAVVKRYTSTGGRTFNFVDYQQQFIKAYQFLKLNEEGYNEGIHQ